MGANGVAAAQHRQFASISSTNAPRSPAIRRQVAAEIWARLLLRPPGKLATFPARRDDLLMSQGTGLASADITQNPHQRRAHATLLWIFPFAYVRPAAAQGCADRFAASPTPQPLPRPHTPRINSDDPEIG